MGTGGWNTPLVGAADRGHIDIVKLLLSKGAHVNKMGTEGLTALAAASEGGHIGIVKLLLAKGADINKGDLEGWGTALATAAKEGHTGIVKLLLQKGADGTIKNKRGETAYDLAANKEIRKLIEQRKSKK